LIRWGLQATSSYGEANLQDPLFEAFFNPRRRFRHDENSIPSSSAPIHSPLFWSCACHIFKYHQFRDHRLPPHLWILILIYNNLYMLLLLIHQQHSIPFRGPFHHIMVFSNMYVGFIVYTTYHKMISCFTSLISDAIIMPSGV
jgi:hypothetical protein